LQTTKDKAVTTTGELSDDPENQNLAQILFFEEDLKLIIEAWPKLSVELRRAIVRMVN